VAPALQLLVHPLKREAYRPPPRQVWGAMDAMEAVPCALDADMGLGMGGEMEDVGDPVEESR
jgi:hypothetical protein